MSTVDVSSSNDDLIRVGIQMPDAISDASNPDGLASRTSGSSVDSFDSSTSDKPPHPHHLKLLALSAELMRPPKNVAGNESSVVNVGLVEEARNRRIGRKERCVHWDRVEINGREFPLQRADTSTIAPARGGPGGVGGSFSRTKNSEADDSKPKMDFRGAIPEESDPSYLLVEHSMCDMCLMTFESSSVSGVITMKRIIEARRQWGISSAENKKIAAASNLYDTARLCALCSQFFCPEVDGQGGGDGGGLIARGVGHSTENVSLSLESMASNKPLPDKASAKAAAEKAFKIRLGKKIGNNYSRQRLRGRSRSIGVNTTSGANFRLDELIADDRCVVKETDLAKQPGAVATQSSTADGMGANVCMGFPPTKLKRGPNVEQTASPIIPLSTNKQSIGSREATTALLSSESLNTAAPLQVFSPTASAANAADAPAAPSTATAHLVGGTSRQDAENSTQTNTVASTRAPPSPGVVRKPRITSPAAAAAAALAAARTCSRTRREEHPWWEVDLGGVYPVRCIRVHHPDRRTEATKAGALPYVDVAPFWVMTAASPIGEMGSEEARSESVASKRFACHKKVTTWELGTNHFAAAVRVQAEGVKSLQLARVEVIKGGGTQQAKDIIQQQHLQHERQLQKKRCAHGHVDGPPNTSSNSTDRSMSSATNPSLTPTRSKSRRVSEHTMITRRLQRLYAEKGSAESASGNRIEHGAGGGDIAGVVLSLSPAAQARPKAAVKGGRSFGEGGDASLAAPPLPIGGEGGGESGPVHDKYAEPRPSVLDGKSLTRPRTCPAGGDNGRRSKPGVVMGFQEEDVRRLLLRAMVGYDWVDDFNGEEVRVRGAFTVRDVGILEEIFLHCALGDDVDARAGATVSDPSMRLDPGEICGDLRRLELQVTNTGSKNKSSMLLAVRESPLLFQLLSSGVVEALPDALARAEGQLAPAQRPLSLDWTRFLGVMGLCLEGAVNGTGTVASSAVARLFEEIHDDKLDFLTRKRSRLPPSRKPLHVPAGGGIFGAGAGYATNETSAMAGNDGASNNKSGSRDRAQTTPNSVGGVSADGIPSSVENLSLLDGTGSIGTGEDVLEIVTAGGAASTGEQGEGDGGGRRRGRGGGTAALKSLLRPQARHEVSRGYGEAMSKRRGRQREALQRAPEPDVEPTRPYKPCGLCQAPFPVDSLGTTVSLKVLGNFLSRSGAPSKRFERKASRLCALHRLPLCVFCSQFFDPDFPDGIVPPRGYAAMNATILAGPVEKGSRTRKKHAYTSSIDVIEGNGLVPFFDDRFPDRWSDTPPPSSTPSPAYMEDREDSALSVLPGAGEIGRKTWREGMAGGRKGVENRREARDLRQAGDLVRGGFSIRDRLATERPVS